MFEVVIKGFKTENQAKAFIEWYSTIGSQAIIEELECNNKIGNISSLYVNKDRSYHIDDTFTIFVMPT